MPKEWNMRILKVSHALCGTFFRRVYIGLTNAPMKRAYLCTVNQTTTSGWRCFCLCPYLIYISALGKAETEHRVLLGGFYKFALSDFGVIFEFKL